MEAAPLLAHRIGSIALQPELADLLQESFETVTGIAVVDLLNTELPERPEIRELLGSPLHIEEAAERGERAARLVTLAQDEWESLSGSIDQFKAATLPEEGWLEALDLADGTRLLSRNSSSAQVEVSGLVVSGAPEGAVVLRPVSLAATPDEPLNLKLIKTDSGRCLVLRSGPYGKWKFECLSGTCSSACAGGTDHDDTLPGRKKFWCICSQ